MQVRPKIFDMVPIFLSGRIISPDLILPSKNFSTNKRLNQMWFYTVNIMMKLYDIEEIKKLSDDFLNIQNSSDSKEKALIAIADRAELFFCGTIHSYPLIQFNGITFHFIDLIDQILFEVRENYPIDSSVREAIFENLLLRLTVLSEALLSTEQYSKNIQSRKFIYEDTVIIKSCGLANLNDILISAFHEYPDLQKHILKAIVSVGSSELTNFYYQIASGSYCYELRLLALLGMKKNGNTALKPETFQAHNIFFNEAVADIIKLNLNNLFEKSPDNYFTDLFELNCAELNLEIFNTDFQLNKLLSRIDAVLKIHRKDSNFSEIAAQVSNILLFFSVSQFETIIKCNDLMKIFLSIMEVLPQENAIFINRRIVAFKAGISITINDLFTSGKIKFSETNSNAIKYMTLDI